MALGQDDHSGLETDATMEEGNNTLAPDEDDQSLACVARDVYSWRGIIYRDVSWFCTNCKLPVLSLQDGRKLCGICEVLEEFYACNPKGMEVGRCNVCDSLGLVGYRCIFCQNCQWWLIHNDSDTLSLVDSYMSCLYQSKKCKLIDAAKWTNFKQWIKMQDIERTVWKDTMYYSTMYPEKLIYWMCSDHRCSYQKLNCNIWCLECGKSARTEIFRSFDRRYASGYKDNIVEEVGHGRITKWVSDDAWLDATTTHIQEHEFENDLHPDMTNMPALNEAQYYARQSTDENLELSKHEARMKDLSASLMKARKEWKKTRSSPRFEPMEAELFIKNELVHSSIMDKTNALNYDPQSYTRAYVDAFSWASGSGDGYDWPGKPPAVRPNWLRSLKSGRYYEAVLDKVKDYYSL